MPITPNTSATITLNTVATTLGNATKNMNGLRGFGGSTPATSGSTIKLSQCQTIQQGVGYYNSWFKATSVTNQGTWASTAITNNSSMTYAVWIVSTRVSGSWRNVLNVNISTADGSRRPSVWINISDTGLHVRHDTNIQANDGVAQTTSRLTMNGTSKFHLVVTLSGSTMKVYLNGALSDTYTFTSSGIPTNAPTTDIVASPGAGVAGVGDYALNYLWFFPYPMTATQVTTYYNSLTGIIGSPSFASGAPSSFVYGSSTASSITFSWTAGSGALSYSVTSSPATTTQTTATTSITFSGLSGGTSYTFTVTSYNGAIAGSAATTGSYSTTSSALYTMTLPFTFTNMGATGVIGPTAISYGTSTPGYNTPYAMTLGTGTRTGMQLWRVPSTKTWTIKAAGAGHVHPVSGNCNGMVCQANYNLTAGQVIVILVGQQGLATTWNGYGGCGGTYVVDSATNTPIIVAGGAGGGGNDANSGTAPISPAGSAGPIGGGGAGGTSGNGGQGCPGVSPTSNRGEAGGGGFNTGAYPTGGNGGPPTVGNPSGKLGGKSFLNGGGASTLVTGGFGGGGDSKRNLPTSSGGVGGGGGGGYSGGGGGFTNGAGAPGGGGGSYGTTSYSGTTLTPVGTNTGMGYVTVQ